jgi:hypothetical protein
VGKPLVKKTILATPAPDPTVKNCPVKTKIPAKSLDPIMKCQLRVNVHIGLLFWL